MARVLKDLTVLPAHPAYIRNGMNHSCLAFLAKAGTHLLTPEGWKAESALGHLGITEQGNCSFCVLF